MTHYITFSMIDHSKETSAVTFNILPVTVGSIAGVVGFVGVLRGDIEDITLGDVAKEKIVMDDTFLSRAAAADAGAQRELKWLVDYEGVTDHKLYQWEIPTADPAQTIAGTDMADFTTAGWIAFIADVEFAFVRTPGSDTQAINIVGATLVGRNL